MEDAENEPTVALCMNIDRNWLRRIKRTYHVRKPKISIRCLRITVCLPYASSDA